MSKTASELLRDTIRTPNELLGDLVQRRVIGWSGWSRRGDDIVFQYRYPPNPEIWNESLREASVPAAEVSSIGETLDDLRCAVLLDLSQKEGIDAGTKKEIGRIIARWRAAAERRQAAAEAETIQVRRGEELTRLIAAIDPQPAWQPPTFRPLPRYFGVSLDVQQRALFSCVHPSWVELGWTIWDLDGDDWPEADDHNEGEDSHEQ